MLVSQEFKFEDIARCMLSNNNLSTWFLSFEKNEQSPKPLVCKIKQQPQQHQKALIRPSNDNIHHPSFMRDKLFWCFYIIAEGVENYEQAKEKIFRFENDFKYKSVDKLKIKENIFKRLKIKLQEVETDLVTAKAMSMTTLHSLAIAYDKSVVFMHDRIYYDFCYGDNPYHLIERKGNDIFLHTGDVQSKIDKIRAELFNVCHPKPINGNSSYTANDIRGFADKLNIEKTDSTGKLLTKTILYAEIVIKIGKLT